MFRLHVLVAPTPDAAVGFEGALPTLGNGGIVGVVGICIVGVAKPAIFEPGAVTADTAASTMGTDAAL